MTDSKRSAKDNVPDLIRDDDALAAINTLDDAFALLAKQGVAITEIKDLGSGFVVLDRAEKDQLVGKPLLILAGQFHDGDNGQFVTLHVVTEDGGKFIVNDGGTGIRDQALKYSEKGLLNGLIVRKGLTRSDYETEIDGKMVKGTTYYLSSV